MAVFLKRFVRDKDGATSIEYALIAAILSLAIVAGAMDIGNALVNFFTDLATRF